MAEDDNDTIWDVIEAHAAKFNAMADELLDLLPQKRRLSGGKITPPASVWIYIYQEAGRSEKLFYANKEDYDKNQNAIKNLDELCEHWTKQCFNYKCKPGSVFDCHLTKIFPIWEKKGDAVPIDVSKGKAAAGTPVGTKQEYTWRCDPTCQGICGALNAI